MSAVPVRCTSPHPTLVARPCGALLAQAGGRVTVQRGDTPHLGSIALKCSRCGTRYVVTARAA
jgi:hypothetical protein